MKYRTTDISQAESATDYLIKLIDQGATVEVKKILPGRSLNQNAYLHLLLGIAGMEWGYSLAEMKTLWKRDIATHIFAYQKNDTWFVRSSADLDSKEMTDAIEQLRKYAAEQSLHLPEPHEENKLMFYSNLIEKEGSYL